jgi:hypothetical protein
LTEDTIVSAYFQLGVLRENFDSTSGWVAKGKGSLSLETIDIIEGTGALKLTMPVKPGDLKLTKTVSWDLSAPEEQGKLRFWVYISDNGTATDLEIVLSNDAAIKNYFLADVPLTEKGKWILINLNTSDWIPSNNKASWSQPIIRVEIRGFGSGGEYYIFDGLTTGGSSPITGFSTFDEEMDLSLTEPVGITPTEEDWRTVLFMSFIMGSGDN